MVVSGQNQGAAMNGNGIRGTAIAGLIALACGTSSSLAATVYDDGHGKVWRQVTDTQNMSWNDIASVCSTDGSTACNGTVNGVNMTGWVFANVDQVGLLFSYFGDFPGGINAAHVPSISGADSFLKVFDPTYVDQTKWIMGWTATPTGQGTYWIGEVFDRPAGDPNGDAWYTDQSGDPAGIFSPRGAWMWQDAVSGVPEPGTWAMFLVGFGAIGGMLRINRRAGAVVRA